VNAPVTWRGLRSRRAARCALLAAAALAVGCSTTRVSSRAEAQARLAPATAVTRDLFQLPPPKGQIVVAVYGFRDQSGQYKPAPDSSFSTAVTQGAGSILVKALQDSGWFIPVERENLQDLLTERKIVRALESPQDKNGLPPQIPQLLPASIIIEGGITAYDSNVRTGGAGAGFLGISMSTQYRVDQVTISLRSVDIRTGRILTSVSTTKSIYSYEVRPSVFKFVNFKDLAQFEAGMTRNEPAELCVREAIESAVVFLVVRGLKEQHWELREAKDWDSPLIKAYVKDDGPGRVPQPLASAAAASVQPASPTRTQG
jgi:curli production assembly/transport component CsgG